MALASCPLQMPFTDIFDYPTPRGVTHEDILNWKLTYKYDTMKM